jgi:hypothetical protein
MNKEKRTARIQALNMKNRHSQDDKNELKALMMESYREFNRLNAKVNPPAPTKKKRKIPTVAETMARIALNFG